MAKYSDVGTGALFENKERNHEKAPNKQGTINLDKSTLEGLTPDEDGKIKIFVSCWTDNRSKAGVPYMGLKLSVKTEDEGVPF